MTDFFAKDRQVAWDQTREELTQVIAKWEERWAEAIEFGAAPDDGFCEVGAMIGGIQAVVANIKDILDRMERS